MLVLSRKPNESIMIGDAVEVKIVEVKGDYVKLGITAPKNIPVHRKEIYEAIQRENIEAAQSGVVDLDKLGDLLGQKPNQDKKPDNGKKDK
ncbi:MAG: carbon storage regulator CsrA [Candidatus Omnitrophica bacterium]|nr:carbon storage regulator CsrA [Candidatus Omnitrophota bacterium]